MNNIHELRTALSGVFDGLRAGQLQHQVAGELNNSCGKILNSLRVELEYFSLRKEKPSIAFLDAPK